LKEFASLLIQVHIYGPCPRRMHRGDMGWLIGYWQRCIILTLSIYSKSCNQPMSIYNVALNLIFFLGLQMSTPSTPGPSPTTRTASPPTPSSTRTIRPPATTSSAWSTAATKSNATCKNQQVVPSLGWVPVVELSLGPVLPFMVSTCVHLLCANSQTPALINCIFSIFSHCIASSLPPYRDFSLENERARELHKREHCLSLFWESERESKREREKCVCVK
jgi:hypothetical protein